MYVHRASGSWRERRAGGNITTDCIVIVLGVSSYLGLYTIECGKVSIIN